MRRDPRASGIGMLVAALALLCAAPSAHAARPLRVTGVRHWTGPDVTRLVLDVSDAADFSVERSDDSTQVTVRVAGVALIANLSEVSVRDSAVEDVTLRSMTGGGVKATIRLTRPTAVRVFALSQVPGRPHRVVVDVTRYVAPEQVVEREKAIQTVLESRARVVVIDPGHGGDAPGAVGPGGLCEKDVTLPIGRKVADRLNARPGIRAVLTRDGDYDLPLRRRFLIAERYQADLFVSIHCNSSRDRDARGTEVYFLSLTGATDEASRELAEAENSADQLYGQLPAGNDDVKSILFDLRQNDTLKKSSELADVVLQSLAGREDLVFRGVKQAGFAVLKSPQVPSILVETAFISNRREAARLRSESFQDDLADLIARGVGEYLERHPSQKRGPARLLP
ncbi:MAG: N-acetylmuramoyl-L-alanine amidase [Candidatus Eisenbacteria bacterium]|nr:N-acetylmuramoyl-L-alanine amidase [Candidatus Eisenbacteria bacterium]